VAKADVLAMIALTGHYAVHAQVRPGHQACLTAG
jgi:hypothetical protein